MASFRRDPRGSGICLIMVVLALCTVARAIEFAGGTGEPNDPYQIATAEQLIAIGSDPNLLNKHFVLVADMDLDPNLPGRRVFDQPVIGTDTTDFSGSFDGRGKTIANLHIVGQRYTTVRSVSISADAAEDARSLVKSPYVGLFKTISPEGCVCNLNLGHVWVDGGAYVAALAVENQGAIINCRVKGVVNGLSTVAGLVATNKGLVACCYADVEITGNYGLGSPGSREVGGLIGYHEKGLVTHCSARGRVCGDNMVGGLIGSCSDEVTNCYAAVDITTNRSDPTPPGPGLRTLADSLASGRQLGGLIGYCGMPSSGRGLRDCYAIGSITAGPLSSAIGGLAGQLSGSTIHCYAATRIVVDETSRSTGGLAGLSYSMDFQKCFFLDPSDGGGPNNRVGEPLTDTQMRRRDSYTGWDFFGNAADGEDDPWFMPDSSYPVLTSQTEITGLIHLPSLRGVELNQALTLIESIGLTVGEITEDYNTEVARGGVLDITPHGALPKGTIVRVAASMGPYRWEENPGDGSPSNPYQIQTRSQFLELGRHPELYSKCFVLMCDIDLGDLFFRQAPVAPNVQGETHVFSGTPFSGRFNGGMHTISNLIISPDPAFTVSNMGLFGSLAAGGKISHLRVENAKISHSGGLQNTGLLCGENLGEIRDCYADGEISYANYTNGTGGLVGANRGFVTRSAAEAKLFFVDPTAVKSQSLAIAASDPIFIFRSGGTARIMMAPRELGILVGINYAVITDCHAKGSITGSGYSGAMGGIAGASRDDGLVASCYCMATVRGEQSSAGPVVSLVYGGGAATNSYYLLDPALPAPASGYGVGLTDSQMRQQASFVGFDFAGGTEDGTADTWIMPQDAGYPVLADERPFDLAGQGTEAEPYLIGSVQDLGLISQHPETHYRLASDIDCSGIVWPAMIVPWFSGALDGSGHSISHALLFTTGPGGLLGIAVNQVTICDLHLEEIEIKGANGSNYVGAVASVNHGAIFNCSATGRISASGCVGGLIGRNSGVVYACRTNVSLTGIGGSGYVGGLIGHNNSGIVVGCHAAGPVTGVQNVDCLGGLIGRQSMNGTLLTDITLTAYCCSTGSVTGAGYTGGLIGDNAGRVVYCLAAGPLAGGSHAGGIVGHHFEGTISHCYFLDPNEGGGPEDGFGRHLTAAQMARMDSFAEWDFIERTFDGIANTWSLPAGAPCPLPGALNTGMLPELEGAGSPDSPYLIQSIVDFCAMSRHPSACYRLDADLDLAATRQNCPPIPLFMGTLDGAGHSVTGLSLTYPCYGGLFGVIHSGASVKNLTVTDANVVGVEEGCAMGILAGADRGNLTNCHVQGAVQGKTCLGGVAGTQFGPLNMSGCTAVASILTLPGGKEAGGLVGWSEFAALSDCCASATILGGDKLYDAGGLAGFVRDGTISRCFALGKINGGEEAGTLGGLVGSTYGMTMRNCYAGVDITTGAKAHKIGGLAGWPYKPGSGAAMEYCYSRGAISVGESSEDVGGLIGYGLIAGACFWDTQASGIQASYSGTGATTAAMQKAQIYKQAGWDFVTVWSICEGKDYPRLRWEQVECK
jgi:hypothetical protein